MNSIQESDYEQSHYRSVSNSPDHYGDRLSPIASPMPARLPAIPVKRGFRSATNSLEEPTSRSPTPDQLQSGNKALVWIKKKKQLTNLCILISIFPIKR